MIPIFQRKICIYAHFVFGFIRFTQSPYLHRNQIKKLWKGSIHRSFFSFVHSTTIKKCSVCVNFLIDFNQTCLFCFQIIYGKIIGPFRKSCFPSIVAYSLISRLPFHGSQAKYILCFNFVGKYPPIGKGSALDVLVSPISSFCFHWIFVWFAYSDLKL